MKTTNVLSLLKSVRHKKCYGMNSPRSLQNPGNSIRYNCKKICCRIRTSETILEPRDKIKTLEDTTKRDMQKTIK